MDKSEINRRMAEEVMGWTIEPRGHPSNPYGYLDENGGRIFTQYTWNPAEDMNQAMMGVDRLVEEHRLHFTFVTSCIHTPRATIRKFALNTQLADAWDKNPATAICLALLEAVENMKKEN